MVHRIYVHTNYVSPIATSFVLWPVNSGGGVIVCGLCTFSCSSPSLVQLVGHLACKRPLVSGTYERGVEQMQSKHLQLPGGSGLESMKIMLTSFSRFLLHPTPEHFNGIKFAVKLGEEIYNVTDFDSFPISPIEGCDSSPTSFSQQVSACLKKSGWLAIDLLAQQPTLSPAHPSLQSMRVPSIHRPLSCKILLAPLGCHLC